MNNDLTSFDRMMLKLEQYEEQRNTAERCGFASWAMLDFRMTYNGYAIMTKEYAECAAMRLRGCSGYADTMFAALDEVYFGIPKTPKHLNTLK